MRRLVFYIFMVLLAMGCTKHQEENPEVLILDDAKILSVDAVSRIKESNPPCSIVVRTFKDLPKKGLSDFCDSVFAATNQGVNPDFQQSALMVIADSNNAVAKYGDSFDVWNDCRGHYASVAYLQSQMSQELSSENRVIDILNKSVNSAIANNSFVGWTRGQLFGFLYDYIKPSKGFFYRFVIRLFQAPVIFVANLFRSYYVATALIAALLFFLSVWIPTRLFKSKKNYFGLRPGKPQFNNQIISTVFAAFHTFVYIVPVYLGILSLAIPLSLFGTEFIEHWTQYSFLNLDDLLGSASSERSLIVSALSTLAFYIGHTTDNWKLVKTPVWGWIMFFSPLCVAWAGFVIYIPSAIYSFNSFLETSYRDLRRSGCGQLESVFYTVLLPTVILVGVYLGIYFGSQTGGDFLIDLT